MRGFPLVYAYISLIGQGEKKDVLPDTGKGRGRQKRKKYKEQARKKLEG